jgi:hypothetical protein
MTFLILYRNQYKNLKNYKQKKTRTLQIFFLLVLGIWEINGTEAEYREAFYNRIKGLSDNAEQFDSSHYYYQELAPTIESNITNHGSNDLSVINCSLQKESGETIKLASSSEYPSTYRNGEYCVTITSDRGSISKVTLDNREIGLGSFRKDSKRNIMQASFANLDDLREKVRAGNIYGYSQETWLDESTGLSFTVQNNIRKNIKIRSMALCFSEEERTTDIYFDVCSKESESEFFDPIKKSIITLHDELSAPTNFPKDTYFIKSGDKISKLKKEGKLREVFKNQSEPNVRTLWIKNSSFQKRVKNNGIMYIATQLPSQYRYGEPDIDFKGLLTEGNVVEGQYFILDGEIEASYSKTYLYKKADNQLFCVKANKGKIKYTDSTDLEWSGSAENTIKYLTKDRPLPGASQTGSHNIEGFYQISGRPIGQRQNWLIFKDETNPSALFSTEFPCITVSDFSPDTFKNDQKKDEEIAFIKFLSDWDLVQYVFLNLGDFDMSGWIGICTNDNSGTRHWGRGHYFGNTVEGTIRDSHLGKFADFVSKIEIRKISGLKISAFSPSIERLYHADSDGVSSEYLYSDSVELIKKFFNGVTRFKKTTKLEFVHDFRSVVNGRHWYTRDLLYTNDPIIEGFKTIVSLTELKELKLSYLSYDKIKSNPSLVGKIKNLKLCLYNTPENQKEAINSTLSGGEGEVFFENDLVPASGCVIS